MTAGSLKLRLLVAAAISVTLALTLAGLALSAIFENEVKGRVMRELNNHLLQLVGLLEADAAGLVRVDGRMADPRFEKPDSGLFWQVMVNSPAQTLLSRSLWDTALSVPEGTGETTPEAGMDGAALLYVSRRITLDADGKPVPVRITTALVKTEVDESIAAFRESLAWSLSALALALIIAAFLQVLVGLRPLQHLQRQMAAIRAGSVRKLEGRFPDEVAPLVGEFNAVLDAQAKSLERARARAGDLAHGLKTPLTVLSALGRDIAKAGFKEEAAEIGEQVAAMRRHTEREMIRARLATGKAVAAARLDQAVARLVAAMKRSPRGEEIAWEINVPENAAVSMDGQDLIELLGNLIDNARKWARERVRVSFEGKRLVIADDGPGVPDADLARIAERGTRLDEKVQGSGLGLSIVHDIADLYGLTVTYGRSALGGFEAAVTFP